MKTEVSHKKQVAGVLYGLAAGLAFAIFAWGMDGRILSEIHGAFPWYKFYLGLPISIIVVGMAGWITTKLKGKHFYLIVWSSVALILSRLLFWIPMKLTPWMIGWLNPEFNHLIQYTETSTLNKISWLGFPVILVVAIFCGLEENFFIEDFVYTTRARYLVNPVVVCIFLFGLAGNITDTLINKRVREPLQTIDGVIQFSVDNKDREFSFDPSRSLQLDAMKEIKGYLNQNRKMVLIFFNDSLQQASVLIDFNRKWAKCSLLYNRVSSCSIYLETPYYWES